MALMAITLMTNSHNPANTATAMSLMASERWNGTAVLAKGAERVTGTPSSRWRRRDAARLTSHETRTATTESPRTTNTRGPRSTVFPYRSASVPAAWRCALHARSRDHGSMQFAGAVLQGPHPRSTERWDMKLLKATVEGFPVSQHEEWSTRWTTCGLLLLVRRLAASR